MTETFTWKQPSNYFFQLLSITKSSISWKFHACAVSFRNLLRLKFGQKHRIIYLFGFLFKRLKLYNDLLEKADMMVDVISLMNDKTSNCLFIKGVKFAIKSLQIRKLTIDRYKSVTQVDVVKVFKISQKWFTVFSFKTRSNRHSMRHLTRVDNCYLHFDKRARTILVHFQWQIYSVRS